MDVSFDTYAAVKRLTNAGFSEAQADALSHTVNQAVTGGVATKADLAELRTDIAEQRVALRMIVGIGAGIVAILVGAFGFGFNILLNVTENIAALQADIAILHADNAAIKSVLAAQAADIAAIKEILVELSTR